MRLVLDITKTRAGRYEGRLTVPGTGSQQDFAGILELMEILEERLGTAEHQDAPPAAGEKSTIMETLESEPGQGA